MSAQIETDYLVIGSGIAGLSFALKAARTGTVAVVTKKELAESNTNYAQGGSRQSGVRAVPPHGPLPHPDASPFLISEAVRGYGGILVNRKGEPFVEKYHEMGSLAPRDVVARAIVEEMKVSGEPCVYLDVTHKDAETTRRRFPNIHERCLTCDIDMTKQPIPVAPVAHYMCGGVAVDAWGWTAIDRLYASGEVACTGLHGANRLASNSLLEALVFSDRALRHVLERMAQERGLRFPDVPDWKAYKPFNVEENIPLSYYRDDIQRLMWNYVGIVRSDAGLECAARRLAVIAQEVGAFYRDTKVTPDLIELRNLATVALLIVRSALMRPESRGLHYNLDHPNRDDEHWLKDTVLVDRPHTLT